MSDLQLKTSEYYEKYYPTTGLKKLSTIYAAEHTYYNNNDGEFIVYHMIGFYTGANDIYHLKSHGFSFSKNKRKFNWNNVPLR